jgi:hypothetical protein
MGLNARCSGLPASKLLRFPRWPALAAQRRECHRCVRVRLLTPNGIRMNKSTSTALPFLRYSFDALMGLISIILIERSSNVTRWATAALAPSQLLLHPAAATEELSPSRTHPLPQAPQSSPPHSKISPDPSIQASLALLSPAPT